MRWDKAKSAVINLVILPDCSSIFKCAPICVVCLIKKNIKHLVLVARYRYLLHFHAGPDANPTPLEMTVDFSLWAPSGSVYSAPPLLSDTTTTTNFHF